MPRFALCLGMALASVASACAGRGLTPLMAAARAGDVAEMRRLLDAGADPYARDLTNGWTALFHAIHTRQPEAVRLLLDRGVSPNQGARATTALMLAAMDPDPAMVELLLARGADPHRRGMWGATALTCAVSGGALADIDRPLLGGCHPATVRALLAHDPTLRLPDSFAGREARFWARLHDCREVLALIDDDR
ncbi:MAG TPA: ankyrin repeat domain-containing protein [Vicinamibacterales bacterium]|nr:ankyrin repeat domain-containing protein [Vicinamibacterales bacterium]